MPVQVMASLCPECTSLVRPSTQAKTLIPKHALHAFNVFGLCLKKIEATLYQNGTESHTSFEDYKY
jgi:hypothetical protein